MNKSTLTKENARLRTRLTKTTVAAGDLLQKVGTEDVYKLDSWEFFPPDRASLLVVRADTAKKAFREHASLSDFGLELYSREVK